MENRTEIIASLIISHFAGSMKPLPSDKDLVEMTKSWQKQLDEKAVPSEDIVPLYNFAVEHKKDMTSFSVSHMKRAWPDYVRLYKTARTMQKETCPMCKGTNKRFVYNVLTGENEQKDCWYNHN